MNKTLLDIFNSALAAVDPYQAVLQVARVERNQLQVDGARYHLGAYARILVIGAGKATARMALALESLLGKKISAGLIVVKDGHTAPLAIIEQVEASHPVPNEAGMAGTLRILNMASAADENTLLICLLSGGASALLVAPVAGITLQDKQETTRLLLNAGASISELNAVRKHLSGVKGGKLAQAAYPAQLLTLLVSDVIGDPLDVIASGPTSPDASTFAEAEAVIAKYAMQKKMPPHVADYLQRGIAGKVEETIKANAPCLQKTQNTIIASLHQALSAAQEKTVRLGYSTRIISEALQGEARDAAHFLAQTARVELAAMQAGEQRCLLCGGETTVAVRGSGMGGRNQEFALAFALAIEEPACEIKACQEISLLSAGTDGSDGPNDAAGAMVNEQTAAQARGLGIDPRSYLENNNAYAFFHDFDAATGAHSHLKTGPTGTNVMDMQIVLLHKKYPAPTPPDDK